MKIIFVLLFWMICLKGYSQADVKIDKKNPTVNFNLDRKFVVVEADAEQHPFPADVKFTASDTGFTSAEKTKFGKDMLVFIDRLVNNLQDDSMYIKSDYEIIWPGFYPKLLQEAIDLQKFLRGDITVDREFIFLPGIDSIKKILNISQTLSIQQKILPGGRRAEGKLITIEPFSTLLYNWCKENINVSDWIWPGMDFRYIRAWRDLEDGYMQLMEQSGKLSMSNDDLLALDSRKTSEAKELLNNWRRTKNNNQVIVSLKQSTALRKMLWFTGGIITINPLTTTEELRRYPVQEKNSFLKPEIIKLTDSLAKAGWPKQLFETSHVVNTAILPVRKEKYEKVLVVQYDAANNYTSTLNDEEYVVGKTTLNIASHNVANGRTSKITTENADLSEQSAAMVAISDAASQVGGLLSAISPVVAASSRIIQMIQPTPLLVNNSTIKGETADKVISGNYKMISDYFSPQISADSTIHPARVTRAREQKTVIINEHTVNLTGISNDDKKRVIVAAYQPDPNRFFKLDSLRMYLINRFISYHIFWKFDYTDAQKSAEKILDDYNVFVTPVKLYQDTLVDLSNQINEEIASLLPYIRISNRSLPPSEIKPSLNEEADFTTQIEEIKLPSPTKTLNYTITETDKKGKTTSSITESLHIVKKVKFDLSAGLAYAYKPFTIIENGNSNLPNRVWTSQFQFVAGAHYYPFGLIKQKDSFCHPVWKERVSVYAGLGIKNALDNYFIGPSYDIIPGIRFISGAQFYRDTRFKIMNNEVIEKARGLQFVSVFSSINIEPTALIKLVGLIK